MLINTVIFGLIIAAIDVTNKQKWVERGNKQEKMAPVIHSHLLILFPSVNPYSNFSQLSL